MILLDFSKLKNQGIVHEVLIIDDGSNFDNKTLLNDFSLKYDIVLITHNENKGYGAALKTGIGRSTYTNVAFFDADGQHRVDDLLKLLQRFEFSDVIIGNRDEEYNHSSFRSLSLYFLKLFFLWITGQISKDPTSGLRVWNKRRIQSIMNYCSDGFSFSATSLLISYLLSFSVKWCRVQMLERKAGKSYFTMAKLIKILTKLFSLVLIFAPLRILTPVVLIFCISGLFFITKSYLQAGEASLKGLILIVTGILIFFNSLAMNTSSKIQKRDILNSI